MKTMVMCVHTEKEMRYICATPKIKSRAKRNGNWLQSHILWHWLKGILIAVLETIWDSFIRSCSLFGVRAHRMSLWKQSTNSLGNWLSMKERTDECSEGQNCAYGKWIRKCLVVSIKCSMAMFLDTSKKHCWLQ